MSISTFQLNTSRRHPSITSGSNPPSELPWSLTPTLGPSSTRPIAPSEPQIHPRITAPNNPINSVERFTLAVVQSENEALRVSPRKNKGKRKTTTPSVLEPEQPTGPKRKTPRTKLSPREDLALIRFCLKHADTYGQSKKDVAWWKNVGDEFNSWLERPFTNHKRHIKELVKTRKLFLEMLQSGDEDETGPFIDAITQWITLVDGFEDEAAKQKKTQQVIDKEDMRASQLRAKMSKTLSQKKRDRPEISQSDSSSDDSSVPTSERKPARSAYNISPPLATSIFETPTPVDRRIHNMTRRSTSTPSHNYSILSSSSIRRASRSSSERSSIPRLTAAKRARLQAEANQTSVARLAEVLADYFERSKSNAELIRKLQKLEHEVEEAKKAWQMQDEKMNRILALLQHLQRPNPPR
ncbi:hypothetical protein ABVK25_001865 [Lepraria finkii]|uniref:Uncharacterized protein n=1 Tax=Lepraria finkii TaxID=1340010 RepID=A0ABR4BLF3_9LECA